MNGRDLARLPAPWDRAVPQTLAGDASTRRWYRLTLPGKGAEPRSAVLMAVPAEAARVADDTVSTFRLLASLGCPVPEVLWAAGRRAIVADAGDLTLERAIGQPRADARPLYRRAVELVVDLQVRGTPAVGGRTRWARRAFDAAFFVRELEISEEHYFRGVLTTARPRWREDLTRFLEPLFAAPQVLCHRDYHSRNLMVGADGGLTVIDCQDARLGPPWYDLVSLLRDSYLDLPEGMELECLALHRRGMSGTAVGAMGEADAIDGYYRAAVQRHLKVLGTFARLADRGRAEYLAWVPRTLGHLRAALPRFPEMAWLDSLLDRGASR